MAIVNPPPIAVEEEFFRAEIITLIRKIGKMAIDGLSIQLAFHGGGLQSLEYVVEQLDGYMEGVHISLKAYREWKEKEVSKLCIVP